MDLSGLAGPCSDHHSHRQRSPLDPTYSRSFVMMLAETLAGAAKSSGCVLPAKPLSVLDLHTCAALSRKNQPAKSLPPVVE
eukprot:965919-Amphidinium_carterae.1